MSLGHEPRAQLASGRPRCNSVLHLFGEWLFEAAHQGSETWYLNNKSKSDIIFILFLYYFTLPVDR